MIYPILLVAFILLCFWRWFFPGFISSGDLWPIASSAIHSFSLWPSTWGSVYGGGLGTSSIPYLWNNFQYGLPIFLLGKIFQLPWEYIVRFGFLLPFLALSVFSSYYFAHAYVKRPWAWLASVIYTINTYSILIISGGQTGVAMAYALSPFVLQKCIEERMYNGIRNGLWLSLLVAMDLRIAYLVFGAILLFHLIKVVTGKGNVKKILCSFAVSSIVVCSLHAFWIMPSVLYRGAVIEVSEVYTNPGMLKFLSFADFSHALSFLHPNWPENLFGKVYFLQPEFLLLPILAFTSFLFISKKKIETKKVQPLLFFVLLALIGAFFAKGVNDPFGGIFNWCFIHIPGFVMFRDPTKFYLYIAIAYAVLIPFTLSFVTDSLVKLLNGKNKKLHSAIPVILFVVFLGFWAFTIRQAVMGKIEGTLHTVVVPRDYQQFENQQSQELDPFFRTFWIPSVHRFAYPTSAHPAIDALTVTSSTSASGVMNWMKSSSTELQFARWNVAYVVVPIDTDGTLFTTERLYDAAKRNEIIIALDEIPWLKREREYTDLAVWRTEGIMGHMWKNNGEPILAVSKTPIRYEIPQQSFEAGDRIVFSESYSPLWIAAFGNVQISSTKTPDGLNQFIIPKAYSGPVEITYKAQQAGNWGMWIGILCGIGYIVFLYGKTHRT
ncbi:MAG: hypothetical protein V1917_01235 [Candidatus Gottesmanbacteria bacterium]